MLNYKLLFGDTWGPKLKEHLPPSVLTDIFKQLKNQSSRAGIFPKPEKIFRCFKECPFDKTMVVFLGVNPYHEHRKWLDGLLFSSPLEKPIPKIEGLIFDAIENNYDKRVTNRSGDLKRWANQGVLLLPLDLTIEEGKKKAHVDLWRPFIEAVIAALHKDRAGVIYVILGQEGFKCAPLIDPLSNDIVYLEHPAKSLALRRNWKHKNVFTYLDRVTNMIFNSKINWYD